MEEYKDNIKRLNEDFPFSKWLSEEEDAKKVTNTLIKNAKEEGKKQGKKEGKIQGKKEQSIEISRKMIKEGLEIEFISKVTGLSKEEIEKLQK